MVECPLGLRVPPPYGRSHNRWIPISTSLQMTERAYGVPRAASFFSSSWFIYQYRTLAQLIEWPLTVLCPQGKMCSPGSGIPRTGLLGPPSDGLQRGRHLVRSCLCCMKMATRWRRATPGWVDIEFDAGIEFFINQGLFGGATYETDDC